MPLPLIPIGVGILVAAILEGCAEETPLYPVGPDERPPLQEPNGGLFLSQTERNTDYTIDSNPPQRLDMVLGDCLGPVSLLAQRLEDICPTLLADRTCESESSEECLAVLSGQCDPEFLEPIQMAADDLEQIVQENADVSLFDLLSGHGSIPVTAMVKTKGGTYPPLTDDLPPTHLRYGSMALVFGDHREEVEEYRQNPVGEFPFDHILCHFYWQEEVGQNESGHVRVAWVPNQPSCESGAFSLKGVGLQYIEYQDVLLPPRIYVSEFQKRPVFSGGDGSFRDCIVDPTNQHSFSASTHNVAVTDYALRTFVDEGIDRADELCGSSFDDGPACSRTLFWDIDWSL